MIQAILAPLTVAWIIPIRDSIAKYPLRITVWSLLVVIVIPVVLGLVAGAATDKVFDPAKDRVKGKWRQRINKIAPAPAAPTIWDWLFTGDRLPESGFVVLEFKGGARVAGAFAHRSMALTSPEPPGLFLESEWQLDEQGNIFCELPGSGGLLIPDIGEVRWVRVLQQINETEEVAGDE